MKSKVIVTTCLMILMSFGIFFKAEANPWRGYRHYYRHGWVSKDFNGPNDYYRYHPVMRYSDGCRRYCPKYDGCKRCYEHSSYRDHYEYRR
jgi:hypothetical protein